MAVKTFIDILKEERVNGDEGVAFDFLLLRGHKL
jgi:hypothetical protein